MSKTTPISAVTGEGGDKGKPENELSTVLINKDKDAEDVGSAVRNQSSIDKKSGKPRRHTIYEVTSIPALQSKKVPIKEKVRAFRKLKYAESICVRQYFEDDIYDTTGFTMSNVYSVSVPNRFSFDPNEQNVLFYIGEKISCECAWFKTSGRVVNFRVLSPEGTPACIISRGCTPFSCFFNPFPCCSKTQFYVSLPDGRYFGRVKKCFHFLRPKFAIYDADDKKVYEVIGFNCGNCCPIWLVSDAIMKIRRIHHVPPRPDEASDEVSDFINKSCTPICEYTTYNLTIADYMGTKHKMLLIALIVLIDFKHFRRFGTVCHLMVWFVWLAVAIVACVMLFYCTAVCRCFEKSDPKECFAAVSPGPRNANYDYP